MIEYEGRRKSGKDILVRAIAEMRDMPPHVVEQFAGNLAKDSMYSFICLAKYPQPEKILYSALVERMREEQ